jgi:nifR3 family TIM-barrel protein
MNSFWHQLPKPFFVLAPMEDVTDAAFRRLIAACGKPDVMYTEFTSADGLLLADERGKYKLMKKLLFSEAERPIVAQLFTSKPDHMERAAALAAELGFDGFDINMGCPDRAIEKQLCGASLIKNHDLARELIRAAKRGAESTGRRMPVSVKTRLGYNTDELEEWLPVLLEEKPATIILHARTRKEMSKVPARWERIKRAVEIRNELGSETLIIGNGDVKDLADARAKAAETGCDGVMLGRAIFGNPWLFANHTPTQDERIAGLIQHIQLFDELLSETVNFANMKKHFKSYISDFKHAKDVREKLMATSNPQEAIAVLLQSEEIA